MNTTTRRILATGIAAALSLPSLHAASGTWNVNAAGNWGTAANWTPAAIPGTAAGDVINLTNDITAARTVTIDGTSRRAGDLNIGDSTAGLFGFTLASSAGTVVLNLDGTGAADATVDFQAGVANTISAPLTLVDNAIIRSNVAFVQTLSGVIAGAGRTLTFNNDTNGVVNAAVALQGQFLVTGANTYSGGTTISDVRVQIQTNNNALGTGAVNVLDGGQFFNNSGLQSIANTFNIAGNGWVETATGHPFGALRLDSGAIVTGAVNMTANAGIGGTSGVGTVNGVVSGAGFTLAKRGGNTIVLGGNNTYSGGTTVSGVLQLNHNNAAGTGDITLDNTTATGTNTLFATRVLLNGGVTIANNFTAGATTGTAGFGVLQQTGTGQGRINGTITLTGGPSAGGHFVGGQAVGNELVLGGVITSSVAVSQRDGRVVYMGGGTGYNSLTATGAVIVGATNGISTITALKLGGSGNSSLEMNGFNQTLASLELGNGGAGSQITGTVNLGGNTLTLNGDVTTVNLTTGYAYHAINATAGGTLAFDATPRNILVTDSMAPDDLAVNSTTITSAGLTKTGAGTLAMNGSTLTGGLTVSAGTLAVGRANVAGNFTTDTLTFGAGATGFRSTISALTSTSSQANVTALDGLTAGGLTTISVNQIGGLTPNGTYTLLNYNNAAAIGLSGFTFGPSGHIAGSLNDTGSAITLTVTGNDRVFWDGTNTSAWATGATGNWKLESNSAQTDYIENDYVVFGDSPVNSSVVIGANVTPSSVLFANSTITSYAVSGAAGIIGNIGITKVGNGTATLTNPNLYTGTTSVQDGVLALNLNTGAAVTVLPVGNTVDIVTPGTFRVVTNDAGFTVPYTLTGNGTLELNAHSVAGGVVAQNVFVTGNNSGLTGTIRLLSPVTGTYRLQQPALAAIGSAAIEVQNGAQMYTAANLTYANSLNIAGTGYADASGNIGALRLEPGSVWSGGIVVNGAARIGAHGGTGTVSGGISGGDLSVNATNYNSSYTLIFTGANSYGTTTIGGQNTQVAGVPSMRLNIGAGGTTGTLGTGSVIIHGDGANGVLGFDRSDGYTLLPGQTITGSNGAGTIANSITRTFIDFETTGTGFNDNGNTITLGAAAPTSGGNIRLGQARPNTVTNITGTLTAEKIQLSGAAAGINATMNISGAANVAANFFTIGEVASGTGSVVNQTGGNVNVLGQLRAGHFGTLTGTYNMGGGTLTLTGASTVNNPSTAGAGGASATGDNNIEAFVTPTIHGGGIYLGIDGQGIFNLNAGDVTTNWIVLDNRGNSGSGANMGSGIDRLNVNGGTLNLRSAWGIQGRNTSTAVSFAGGTVRVDNTGTGGGAGNTGANITVALDADITTSGAGTTLDTNGAGNAFSLTRTMNGTAPLTLTGGGSVNVSTAGFQTIVPALVSSGTGATLTKLGAGVTTLTGSGAGFTGITNVNAGVLNVPANFASPTINVADAAGIAGEPTTTNLNLGTAAGAVVYFDPNTAGALTAGALSMAGSTTLDFTTSPTGAGPWTAMNYTTTAGAAPVLANGGAYRVAPIVTDTGSSYTVNVTGLKTLTWTGAANANWNNNLDTNWNDGAGADNFFAGDTVIFPEGGANPAVAVASGVSPFTTAITAATTNYTLTSAGTGIGGPGSLVKTGASTLVLVGANTYRGTTTINEGTVSIASGLSLGLGTPGNNIELSGGGRLMATAALDTGASRNILIGAGGGVIAQNRTANDTITINGAISGSDALAFNVLGTSGTVSTVTTFALTGANSGYTGPITISTAGNILATLSLTGQASVPNASAITINHPAGSVTSGNANGVSMAEVTLPAATTLNFTSFQNGAISLRSQLVNNGNSTINGNITVSGSAITQFTHNNGTLTFNGNVTETTPGAYAEATAGSFSNVLFYRGAGTHVMNGTWNLPSAGSTIAITDGATLIVNTTGNIAASTGALFGAIRLGINDALPTAGRYLVGQAGDQVTTLDLNGFNQTVTGIRFDAPTGNLLTKGISNTNTTTASTFTVVQNSDVNFNGTFSGRTNLVKNGTGRLTLQAGASNTTGNITVNSGILQTSGQGPAAGGNGGLGAANVAGKTITVNTGGTLDFTINNVFGNGVGNNNLPAITLAGGTLSGTRYNVLGALTLNGGTLTQSATDGPGAYEGWQFRGDITVGGSAASLISTGNGKANHLGPVTNFNVANATGDSAADLVISAPLRNQSGDFASAVGNLVKSGAGTMELTATSTYTGTTNVDAGTLLVNGSISASSLTSINAGGTLGGSGGLGALDLNGGTLAPGNSTGILTANGSVDFGGGSFAVEINGLTAGAEYDQLAVLGLAASTVTISANTALDITLGFTPAVNDAFILVDNDGPDPILTTALFTIAGNPILDGADFTVSGSTFQLTYAGGDGNDIELLVVPEPGSAALLLGGLALLAGSRRRKK